MELDYPRALSPNGHQTRPSGANGIMPLWFGLPTWFMSTNVAGGGFHKMSPHDGDDGGAFAVCLTEAWQEDADFHLPIKDFSVPTQEEARKVVEEILRAIVYDRRVFVGCTAGWGRTGTILALLAKVTGEPDPVHYVRTNYTEAAVETPDQQRLVDEFDPTGLQWLMAWWRVERWWGVPFWRGQYDFGQG